MPPVPLLLLRRDEPPKRNDRRGVMAPLATCRGDDPTAADCEPQLRAARPTPRTECDELGVLRPSSACLPRSDDPSLARLHRARVASLEKLHHAFHNSETAFSGKWSAARRVRLVYGSIGSSDRPFARRAALVLLIFHSNRAPSAQSTRANQPNRLDFRPASHRFKTKPTPNGRSKININAAILMKAPCCKRCIESENLTCFGTKSVR